MEEAIHVPLPPDGDEVPQQPQQGQHQFAGQQQQFAGHQQFVGQQPWFFPPQQPQWWNFQQQQQQQVANLRLKLTDFWPNEARAWFELAEAEFDTAGIADPRARYQKVLPALPKDVIEKVRGILHVARNIQDPYNALKARLLELYTPSDLDLVTKLLRGGELGGRRPSDLMEEMLASLPVGEQPGLLFKGLFLNRLPSDLRDRVAENISDLGPRELAVLADTLWIARNSKPKGGHVAAAAVEDLETTVAALAVSKPGNKKRRHFKKEKDKKPVEMESVVLCYNHRKFKEKAYSCQDPAQCQWSGN